MKLQQPALKNYIHETAGQTENSPGKTNAGKFKNFAYTKKIPDKLNLRLSVRPLVERKKKQLVVTFIVGMRHTNITRRPVTTSIFCAFPFL